MISTCHSCESMNSPVFIGPSRPCDRPQPGLQRQEKRDMASVFRGSGDGPKGCGRLPVAAG